MLETLSQILLALSWKAPLIAGGVWLIVRLTPLRRSPAAHHALWIAAALTLLCLPALEALRLAQPASAPMRLTIDMPVAVPAGPPASPAQPVPATPRLSPAEALAGLYLLGLAIALGRLAFGWHASRRFRRSARPVVGQEALSMLDRVAARAGLEQVPLMLESGRFAGPVTVGLLRPTIVLPSGHEAWAPSRLESVLAHECAHIARHDTRTAALTALTRALYWFHPVAALLGRPALRLMEQACDDFAVRLSRDPRAYANALVATASLRSNAEPSNIGALSMASHLSSRVDRILNGLSRGSGIVRRRTLAMLAVAALAVTATVGVLTPVWAQQSGVTLEGAVVDASGARVPGVAVIVRDTEQGVTEATVSGADGAFVIRGLPPSADYQLEIEAAGFTRASQKVSLLENAQVEVKLEVGRIREAIVVEAEAPEQPAAGRTPERIRVGGNVQKAKMLHYVQPEYPEEARAEGVEGTVLLEAVISASGQPVSLTPLNNLVDSRLVAAATDAVSQWRYKPTQLNGQPVEVATSMTVGFRLR